MRNFTLGVLVGCLLSGAVAGAGMFDSYDESFLMGEAMRQHLEMEELQQRQQDLEQSYSRRNPC